MFIGHFALARAAKRAIPRLSLATLFVAAQFADIFRGTRSKKAAGRWGLGNLAMILVVVYLANVVGSAPPSVPVLAAAGIVGFVLLTWWSR